MTEEMGLSVYQPAMPVMTVEQALERRAALVQFVKSIMVKDVDYGVIPGTDKDTLLKPGAEKLTTFFGLTPVPVLVEKEEDWTGEGHGGEPFFYYWFRYELYRGDKLVAAADGSCNSWEAKYRYRLAERTCPNCGQQAIIKGKPEYGGGWLCWQRKGGCGAKWPVGAKEIEDQEVGKVLNPNPADMVNTIKKMAQKRALVAVTLLGVNASEFFTQDLEDFDIVTINGNFTATKPTEKPKPSDYGDGSGDDEPEQGGVYQRPEQIAKLLEGCAENADLEGLEWKQFHGAVVADVGHFKAQKHIVSYLTQELGQNWGQHYTKSELWLILKHHAAERTGPGAES